MTRRGPQASRMESADHPRAGKDFSMNTYQTILFDLDGTLTDPKIGITSSVAYALESFGIHIEDRDSLCPFIGPPLKQSFRAFFGFDDRQAAAAVEKYREYFSVTGIFENQVYQGIPELLANLKADGRTVLLATSKPTVFAERILKHFGLDPWFDGITGSELDGTRVNKWEVIDYALHKAGITDRQTAVMVGDRSHDVIGALKNNIPCIGVLYGYGDLPELQSANEACIARTVSDLANLLLQSTLT